MDLIQIYHAVQKALDAVDFAALYGGFRKYRFALYNENEICLDGRWMPYQKDFLGNTSILYEGEHIAIWSLERDTAEDTELLAYSLVHEMFHCHQRVHNEQRYPSDLDMVNCPDDTAYYLYRYNENLYLADACEHQDRQKFLMFLAVRAQRKQLHPEAFAQEIKAEGLEGLAEYIGLKALRQLNAKKFNAITQEYLGKLRAQDELLFDARRLAYYTGALYFFCLEQFGYKIRNDFSKVQSAYEQNAIDISHVAPHTLFFCFVEPVYASLKQKKKAILSGHISQSRHIDCKASICGYDPMNMFRIGNLLFCKSFVFLKIGDRVENKTGPIALEMSENSNWEIVGYYISENISK